jgi:hypothetical protein
MLGMTLRGRTWLLAGAGAGVLCALLVLAPAASAASGTRPLAALGFLGLPSLHSIIEAIAKGFFSALAGALVPGFLKHGTVATIQHLVALPDPARWGHLNELEGDMTYLGMSLMPVSLAVCTLRYWMVGLTGAAHPATGIVRCAWATFVLVIYRWLVEQVVAATNTLTHAILGFPVVAGGLASIVTVLFGGALLVGAVGVFGAFLVIVGVAFGAGLFASKVGLTDVLALAYCAGPLFIALWPIPELSHLARAWGHALMAVVLVPLGWTILFAVAGALTLDATSVNGGAAGIGGHIEAAFAGLITFVIAVKLPLMLLGELRNILGGTSLRASGGAQGKSTMPGGERIRAAQARVRTVALEGIPSLGRSAGRAAGAMGAPAGGPLGAARRGLAGASRRSGVVPGMTAAAGGGALGGIAAGRVAARRRSGAAAKRGGIRERLSRAGTILASAPRDARAAMAAGSRRSAGGATRTTRRTGTRAQRGGGASNATGATPARVASSASQRSRAAPTSPRPRTTRGTPPPATPRIKPQQPSAAGAPPKGTSAPQSKPDAAHPGRRVTSSTGRETSSAPPRPANHGGTQRPPKAAPPPAPSGSRAPRAKRRPRPRGQGGGR